MKRAAALTLCAFTLAGSALAAAPAGPLGDKPAGPQSLPGDNLPPFNMLGPDGRMIPMPELKGHGPPRAAYDAPGPNRALATELAAAVLTACEAQGFHIGAAVIDSAGQARAMLTSDGADGSYVFVAHRKALAALEFHVPSSVARTEIAAGRLPVARVTPAMFVMGGAVPLMRGGKLIGAVAASGAAGEIPGERDESCARAAVEKLAAKLK